MLSGTIPWYYSIKLFWGIIEDADYREKLQNVEEVKIRWLLGSLDGRQIFKTSNSVKQVF